jgi:hypothetical protein
MKESAMRHVCVMLCTLFLCATILLIAVFVWPTPYAYDTVAYSPPATYLVKVHRFTGKADILFPTGWVEMRADTTDGRNCIELPAEDLSRIAGTVQVDNERLTCDVYNGSSYRLFCVIISVTVADKHGNPVLTRDYEAYHGTGDLLWPLHSGAFTQSIRFPLDEGQRLSGSIRGARGVKI